MHWCADETIALLAVIPGVLVAWRFVQAKLVRLELLLVRGAVRLGIDRACQILLPHLQPFL